MRKAQSYSNKPYWKKSRGENKDKWDHSGYDALMSEDNKPKSIENYQNNYYLKKKREDNFRNGKDLETTSKFPHYKADTQLFKCYLKKPIATEDKSRIISNCEKAEKIDDKELVTIEDKLSNVSTSFSSKEKPLEEDSNILNLNSLTNSSSQTKIENSTADFQINLIIGNEARTIEIFKEEEVEDKINEIVINNAKKNNTINTLITRIYVLHYIKLSKVFSESLIEKLLDKYLETYGKFKASSIEKIEELADEEV